MVIVVETYNSSWPLHFHLLHDFIWPHVCDIALSIEHVGSTSVPGLTAKPIIDVDIIIRDVKDLQPIVHKLSELGYIHQGNMGIDGRDSFSSAQVHATHFVDGCSQPSPSKLFKHNLYVCIQHCLSLRNHLQFRDYLRFHGHERDNALLLEYGELKLMLANRFSEDIHAYVEGKTHFILSVLAKSRSEASLVAAGVCEGEGVSEGVSESSIGIPVNEGNAFSEVVTEEEMEDIRLANTHHSSASTSASTASVINRQDEKT